MAPKKNTTGSPQKATRKRASKVTPAKPPPKTPTLFKVKIGSPGSKPPKIEKKLSSLRKIELANEVALAQLQAKTINIPEPARKSKRTPLKRHVNNTTSENEIEAEMAPPKKKKPGPKCKTMPHMQTDHVQSLLEPICSPEVKEIMPKPIAQAKKVVQKSPKPIAQTKNGVGRKKKQKVPIVYSSGPDEAVQTEEIQSTPVIKTNKVNKCKQTPKTAVAEVKEIQSIPVIKTNKVNKSKQTPKKAVAEVKEIQMSPTPRRTKGQPPRATKISQTNATKGMNAKEIKAAANKVEKNIENYAHVNSRPNSVISTQSNLSWTKDISTGDSFTSGTTTCVTVKSDDFVCFNNKLPIVQVKNGNFEHLINISQSSVSSSDSESSTSSSSQSELDVVSDRPELNLSTSSVTSKAPLSDTPTVDNMELLRLMVKLDKSLENFDSIVSKWIAYDDDDSNPISDVLDVMDPEVALLINNCENFKSVIDAANYPDEGPKRHGTAEQNYSGKREGEHSSPKSSPSSKLSLQKTVRNDIEVKFAKPCNFRRVSVAKTRNPLNNPAADFTHRTTSSKDCFTPDNFNYVPSNVIPDDDDALSLFAESITGVESSRLDSSISNVSLQDIYVPKPSPRSWMMDKYVYKPTKIQADRREESMGAGFSMAEDEHDFDEANQPEQDIYEASRPEQDVYEANQPEQDIYEANQHEQNIYEANQPKHDINESYNISRPCVSSSVSTDLKKMPNKWLEDPLVALTDEPDKCIRKTPSKSERMFSVYTPKNPIKSSLYKGYCFFYIAQMCKNLECRFRHVDMDCTTMRYRLAALSEDDLIEEYLLMLNSSSLRRNFSLLFIEESKRRKDTRILFEMAIDLGLGIVPLDETLRVKVLEMTLLHLNTISLDACDDLLKYEHNNSMMCDALIVCMANSQNFAQFKRAFEKLANFMCEMNRPVDIKVAENILERVCILPVEECLARGMMSVMKNTDVRIFQNSMTKSFEAQLGKIESAVYELYLDIKRNALQSNLALPDALAARIPLVGRGGARHTSPDSTNLDSLRTPKSSEPTFTRTININNEAIRDLFKSPTNPVPKRYPVPRQQWRRDYDPSPMRGRTITPGLPRGRVITRMPIRRRVYNGQKSYRKGANV